MFYVLLSICGYPEENAVVGDFHRAKQNSSDHKCECKHKRKKYLDINFPSSFMQSI